MYIQSTFNLNMSWQRGLHHPSFRMCTDVMLLYDSKTSICQSINQLNLIYLFFKYMPPFPGIPSEFISFEVFLKGDFDSHRWNLIASVILNSCPHSSLHLVPVSSHIQQAHYVSETLLCTGYSKVDRTHSHYCLNRIWREDRRRGHKIKEEECRLKYSTMNG